MTLLEEKPECKPARKNDKKDMMENARILLIQRRTKYRKSVRKCSAQWKAEVKDNNESITDEYEAGWEWKGKRSCLKQWAVEEEKSIGNDKEIEKYWGKNESE